MCSLLLVSACATQPLTVTREPAVLHIVASDVCGPALEELALVYQESHPWATVSVETFDAAVAEERLRAGMADLGALSWLTDEPTPLWSIPFATDTIVVVVHPDVPITGLGRAELQAVFRGRIGEWSDGTPIQLISREEGAGSRAIFERAVMDGYDISLTALVVPDNAGVLDAVASSPGAIGYLSSGWLSDQVRALSIDGITATLIQVDANPFSYPLLLCARSDPAGEGRTFSQWLLGPAAQQHLTRRFGAPP
ncbi:MAG: substrate-binding domain-containing protein [Anaerolineae bacterium]|nr:substrate-binding domain-containing protein [Anaerolineae bacterium]